MKRYMTYNLSNSIKKFSLHGLNLLVLLPLAVAAMAVSSCIKNDIPYPRIQPNFTEMEAPGLMRAAEIDSANRLVTLNFDESIDIENVTITSYSLSAGATIVAGNLDEPIDLSKYYIVTLRLYQDYDWVIQGKQTIDRYFTVENQVGSTIIDVTGRRVMVTLSGRESLKQVKVLTMKFGPQGATVTPDIEGKTIDLTHPVAVTVNSWGREEVWTIYGEFVDSSVSTMHADAWTNVAWVYGTGVAGRDNGVKYRVKGTDGWTDAPKNWITSTGGTFYARLIGLEPLTTYEALAYSDSEQGSIVEFTTGGIQQLPNADFSEWSRDGKVWQPWGEGQEAYWGTGNRGAATLGESNTVPSDESPNGEGHSAKLETRFVGIGPIGKIAAGNIFTGRYVRTDGTNGIVSMGRPFTERPTRVTGYLKYHCEPISHTNNEYTHLKGRPDTCTVWIALIDSAEPFEVRTNPANRSLFDPNGDYVVAYGSFQSGESIPDWVPFDVEFQYRSTSRVPKYIIVTASASKYGDFFTGGNGSVMYVTDINLGYDYPEQ